MPSFRVVGEACAVAREAAALIAAEVAGGARTVVLAGGGTPRRCYELLAVMEVDWSRVTFLFGDERCVPPDHPESNYRMASQALLSRIRPAAVHRIRGELGAEAAAAEYDAVVRSLPGLDLVLLGVGPDGHTASLFPGNPALRADGFAVAVHGAPKPPPDRVSLTLRALRAGRRVLVLATGPDKAGAVRRAAAGTVPAGMIEHAEWLLDHEAAAELGSGGASG